jgi:hypothetical protein
MNLQQLVHRMQGGGFNTPRSRVPKPFPSRPSIKPSLDALDRIRLQQVQWLWKQQGRQRGIGDARFDERVG